MTRPKFANRIDTSHPYVPAAKTDIRKTIAREKKRLAEQAKQQAEIAAEREVKVARIGRKGVA